jgi:tetratricopeptide (TPR) repeat protein
MFETPIPARAALAGRPVARLVAALALCSLTATSGCSSLNEEDELRLTSYKQRSKEYYTAGHYERAQDQCRRGLLLAAEDQSLLQVLGWALLQQTSPVESLDRRLQESAQIFEQAIASEDEIDLRSRVGLGEACNKIVGLRLAKIEEVRRDEQLLPEERERMLARLETDLAARAARGEEVLREVLEQPRTKDNDLALSALARILAQTRRYEEAEEQAAHLTAVLTRSINLRSQQIGIENQPAEVRIAVHGDVERLRSTRTDALLLRANVLAKLGRPHDVVGIYAQIEANQAMKPADYFNRAQAHEKTGALDAAFGDYDKFIQLAASQGLGLSDTVRAAIQRKAELSLKLAAKQ